MTKYVNTFEFVLKFKRYWIFFRIFSKVLKQNAQNMKKLHNYGVRKVLFSEETL